MTLLFQVSEVFSQFFLQIGFLFLSSFFGNPYNAYVTMLDVVPRSLSNGLFLKFLPISV